MEGEEETKTGQKERQRKGGIQERQIQKVKGSCKVDENPTFQHQQGQAQDCQRQGVFLVCQICQMGWTHHICMPREGSEQGPQGHSNATTLSSHHCMPRPQPSTICHWTL